MSESRTPEIKLLAILGLQDMEEKDNKAVALTTELCEVANKYNAESNEIRNLLDKRHVERNNYSEKRMDEETQNKIKHMEKICIQFAKEIEAHSKDFLECEREDKKELYELYYRKSFDTYVTGVAKINSDMTEWSDNEVIEGGKFGQESQEMFDSKTKLSKVVRDVSYAKALHEYSISYEGIADNLPSSED